MSTRYQESVYRRLVLLFATLIAIPSFGQGAMPNNAKERPSFEAATIKPFDESKHEGASSYSESHPGLLKMGGSLYVFIERAYGLHEEQILGGPTWAKSEAFDINAKAPAVAGGLQMNAMLQSLLQERFKLAVHPETKDGAVYSLVAAKGGAKMKDAAGDAPRGSGWGATMLRGTMSTADLASHLSTILGRPVQDHSGLSGVYKVDMKWASETQTDGPSIFTAIQEQLGLKLEPAKGPIEFLVIDHVEKPSEN